MDFNVKSDNPNSSLTKDQELNLAYLRGNPTDKINVDYAMKNGWTPTPTKDVAAVTGTPNIANPAAGNTTSTVVPPVTTTPGTLTSDTITNRTKELTDFFNTAKAKNATALEQSKAAIEADYQRQLAERKAQQEEERATEGAIQFRLGQAGTNYAADQTSRNNIKRNAALDSLLREKEMLIAKAEAAASDNDFKALQQLRSDIYDVETKQEELTRQAARDKMADYLSLANLDINKSQEDRQNKLFLYNQQRDTIEDQTKKEEEQRKLEQDLVTNGYQKLKPSDLSKVKEEDIIRITNALTGTVDIYKKPPAEVKTQIVTANGRSLLIDTATGNTIRDLGSAYKGTGSGGSSKTSDKQTPEEVSFRKDLSDYLADLSSGAVDWGTAWNYMYSRYRNDLEASAKENGMTVAEVLDNLLNKNMFYPKENNNNSGGFFSGVKDWFNNINNSGGGGNESTPDMIQ